MAEVALGRYRDTWYRCERDSRRDLRCAAYVLGVQGTGKSTHLAHLAEQFVAAGDGVLVVDTKGELAEDIAARTRHADRLVYVAPGVTRFPSGRRFWALNPLEFDRAKPELAAFVIGNLLSLLERMGLARFDVMVQVEQLLRMGAQLAMVLPQPTLYDLMRVIQQQRLRRELLRQPEVSRVVRDFWDAYNALTPKQQHDKAGSTIPRLTKLLAHEVVEQLVAQPRSTIRLSEWLDRGQLVVCNLGKHLDADTSLLLGNFLVASLTNAAYARPTVNETPRLRVWRVVVDEFHQLSGTQFAELIEQGRKHQVFPVVAHQNLAQLSDRPRTAAFSCPLKFFLRVSPEDEPTIRRLEGAALGGGLARLDDFHARARLPGWPEAETLRLDGWWAERDHDQLQAAEAAAEDDRYTVRQTAPMVPSEPSDDTSNTASDGLVTEPVTEEEPPRDRPDRPERPVRPLLAEVDADAAAAGGAPAAGRGARQAVAAQAHRERPARAAGGRPPRLLDELPD